MTPVPLDKLGLWGWRNHKSALWWLGLLYRRPREFPGKAQALGRVPHVFRRGGVVDGFPSESHIHGGWPTSSDVGEWMMVSPANRTSGHRLTHRRTLGVPSNRFMRSLEAGSSSPPCPKDMGHPVRDHAYSSEIQVAMVELRGRDR